MTGYKYKDGMRMIIVSDNAVVDLSIEDDLFMIECYTGDQHLEFKVKRSDLKDIKNAPDNIKKLVGYKE